MDFEVRHAEQAFVHRNGMTIAYDTFGESTAPPLLLIMGLGGQMISWADEFCGRLAVRGYRVVRFDNRDVGLSSSFDHARVPDMVELTRAMEHGTPPTVPYTLYDMAGDTVGLIDALGIDAVHLVGSSMGGRIAQIVAIEHPTRVRTLTSIMSHMGESGFSPPNPEALIALLTPAPSDRAAFIEYSIWVAESLRGPAFPLDEQDVRQRAARSFDRNFNPAGVARQYAAMMATGSVEDHLRTLRVPTLIIHGSDDPLISVERARRMANVVPGATLLVVEGMGHSLSDTPQVWPTIIDAIVRHTRREENDV
jgi:pimeloyl-ACP methyl ester carboxylesterase